MVGMGEILGEEVVGSIDCVGDCTLRDLVKLGSVFGCEGIVEGDETWFDGKLSLCWLMELGASVVNNLWLEGACCVTDVDSSSVVAPLLEAG